VLATASLTAWARPVYFVDGYARAAAEVARLAPRGSTVMFSGYRDGSFVFNLRAREDRRDLHVMRADKLLLGVAGRARPGDAARLLDRPASHAALRARDDQRAI